MEQLNKVELIGIIGTVRVQTVLDTRYANMSVATNFAYKDKEGKPVVETTWHNVKVWESPDIKCLDKLKKGEKIHILGRIRIRNYTDQNGNYRMVTEILANKVKIL